jgi:predicted secreted protein
MKKFALLALLAPVMAFAEPTLHLDADARAQVANDEMVVNMSIERDGPDSAPLTDAVLSALNDAVKDAKKVSGINTRLGNVSTHPNWNQNKKIGWVVRGEITLTSKDMKALSTLTGNLSQKLQLSGVNFRLSEAKRTEEESRLLKIAAANFKAKAAAAANAFGYQDYALKEMTLGQSGYVPSPRPMMAMAMSMKAERAMVPVEGGDSEVSVTVNGKIELVK